MAFQKINSYTWIVTDEKTNLEELKKFHKEKYVDKAVKNVIITKEASKSQEKNYKSFCTKIFEERKFISMIEFNKMIQQNFNNNTTYYRKRMIELNLITVRNKVVYPVQ